MNVLLLTKTDWGEPPRLRHQVANLLLSNGCNVVFAQKPVLINSGPKLASSSPFFGKSLLFLRHRQLLHHQLRLNPVLHHLNSFVEAQSLARSVTSLGSSEFDVIINFNYDAFWLRRVFPDVPIATIINDDFEAQSRLPFKRHLTWALKRTCAMSDVVLAVSEPLCRRLSEWCKPNLFLPWAPMSYRRPSSAAKKNVVLFWGYINSRIDFRELWRFLEAVDRYRLPWVLRFIGPISPDVSAVMKKLSNHPRVEIMSPLAFDSLPLDDCVVALNPYRIDCESVRACQLSNKSLQLLSRGLPLVCSDMPAFHRASFVFRYGVRLKSLHECIESASNSFWLLQSRIQKFVDQNGPDQRFSQISRLIGSRDKAGNS